MPRGCFSEACITPPSAMDVELNAIASHRSAIVATPPVNVPLSPQHPSKSAPKSSRGSLDPESPDDSDSQECNKYKIQLVLLLLATLFVAVQLSMFNVYFVIYGHTDITNERMLVLKDSNNNYTCAALEEDLVGSQSRGYAWQYLAYFGFSDFVAVLALFFLPTSVVYQKLRQLPGHKRLEDANGTGGSSNKSGKKPCSAVLDNSLRYSAIVWAVYSIALVAKIAWSSYVLFPVLQYFEYCAHHPTLGVTEYFLLMGSSCLIFLTLVSSHHAHDSKSNEWRRRLIEKVTFDLLDGTHFLVIVFDFRALEFMLDHPGLKRTIITLTCINFILPAVSLIRIRRKMEKMFAASNIVNCTLPLISMIQAHLPQGQQSQLMMGNGTTQENHAAPAKKSKSKSVRHLLEEELYAVVFLIFINLPYLIIRCYLWHLRSIENCIFILKNAVEVFVELEKIWNVFRKFRKGE